MGGYGSNMAEMPQNTFFVQLAFISRDVATILRNEAVLMVGTLRPVCKWRERI
jgi:hypothetical protein